MTELIVKASILEDGLLEQVENLIERNPRLFEGEKVVLMADAHKTSNDKNTNSVPVGFTMTLSKGLVPVDFVSADICCGVTGVIIKDYVPSKKILRTLNSVARDILPVNRAMTGNGTLTDLGTLGGGNHMAEIGTNGKDTLIAIHSGSRNFGGAMFKKHKDIATKHTKAYYKELREDALKGIEPKEREEYLKSLPKTSNLPILDTELYPEYWEDLSSAYEFAEANRMLLLTAMLQVLVGDMPVFSERFLVQSVHNYIDTSGEVPIVRKGSISANAGEQVIIPINMRDGILVGTVSDEVGEVNYSLPHGAGRLMSRTEARNTLSLEQFEEDMKDVFSPTVGEATLDESPRAYKPIETIIEDIKPYLTEYTVFKPVFNYKGVE